MLSPGLRKASGAYAHTYMQVKHLYTSNKISKSLKNNKIRQKLNNDHSLTDLAAFQVLTHAYG